MLEIVIDGIPLAKKRHRTCRGRTYNPQYKEATEFSARLAMAVVKAEKSDDSVKTLTNDAGQALGVELTFYMPMPLSLKRRALKCELEPLPHHTKKPDVDNLVKFVLDCGNGVLFVDDKQIVQLKACKLYDHNPRIIIRLYRIDELNQPRENN